MLTQEQLAEIRKRTEAATPGPWKEANLYIESGDNSERLADVCERVDAEFIAHAREDVPKLLAEIDRLKAEIEEESLQQRADAAREEYYDED